MTVHIFTTTIFFPEERGVIVRIQQSVQYSVANEELNATLKL